MGRPARVAQFLLGCGMAASCAATPPASQSGLAPLQTVEVVRGPEPLSPYNPHNADEDPSLIRAQDGRYVVCWFSNRDGDDHLYLMQSSDGRRWSRPVQVTRTNDGDFYPSLHQSPDGRFHLAWFRASKIPPFNRHIWHSSSDDGLYWDPRREVRVTHGWVSDWAPSLVSDASGRLLIYFASKRSGDASKEIYVVQSADRGATWSAPAAAEGVNDPQDKDDFPYVVRRPDGTFLMAWTRSSKRFGLGMFDGSMDIFVAASSDGLNWRQARDMTRNDAQGITDVLPLWYPRHDGGWSVGWVSTRTDPRGDVLSAPADDAQAAGGLPVLLVRRPGEADYSPRVVPTDVPGEYLMVWVTISGKTKLLLSQIVRGR